MIIKNTDMNSGLFSCGVPEESVDAFTKVMIVSYKHENWCLRGLVQGLYEISRDF